MNLQAICIKNENWRGLNFPPHYSKIQFAILRLLLRKKLSNEESLRGKELGVEIVQQTDGFYVARYSDKHGKRRIN